MVRYPVRWGGGGELDIIVCALPAEGGAVCVCVCVGVFPHDNTAYNIFNIKLLYIT